MKRTACRGASAAALLGLFHWLAPAFAQNAATLGEVQVNADRTDSAIVDTATGVSQPITGEQLSESNLNTLSEASTRVPGFYGFGATPRQTGFSIRGLGNNQTNDGLDSSVGLYADGVYLARQAYGVFGLYDIEDITVLRGPQGTSYGLGSTAGEVLLRTRMPSHVYSQNFSLSAGKDGYQRIESAVTGSLLPGELAARFSVYGQVRDGLLFNQTKGNMLNNQNRLGIRGQLLYTPADDLVVRIIGEHAELDQRCCAFGLLSPVSDRIRAADEYMGYERTGTDPSERVIKNNVDPLANMTRQAASMIVEWGPVGRHRFVSVTGLNQVKLDPARNDDGTSMNLVEGRITAQSQQFSQELRLHSKFKRLETTLGVLYLNERLRGRELGILGDEIALWALGGTLRRQVPTLNRSNSGFLIDAILPGEALNGLQLDTPYSQRTQTYSTFFSGDWHTSPDTTVTTGLRYTASSRSARISRSRSGGNLNSSPLALTNQLAAIAAVLGQDASAVTYDGLLDSLVGESFDRSDTRKDHGVSGRLALSHRLGSGLVTQATLTQGYKSGGLNLAGLTPNAKPQFEPETVTSLEFGVRSARSASELAFAVTAYHSVVKDFQALTYDVGTGVLPNPRQNNVINIPEVRLQGIELDLTYPVNPGLVLGAGLAYNRAISTRFPNAADEISGLNNKDLSGKQLYNAPRWSGYAAAEKRFALDSGRQAYAGIDQTFRSATFGAVDQSRSSFIDAYQLTNLRVGLRDFRNNWNIQAWVKNVFDEDYLSSIAALYTLGDYGGYAGDPLSYGITLDFTLGK